MKNLKTSDIISFEIEVDNLQYYINKLSTQNYEDFKIKKEGEKYNL